MELALVVTSSMFLRLGLGVLWQCCTAVMIVALGNDECKYIHSSPGILTTRWGISRQPDNTEMDGGETITRRRRKRYEGGENNNKAEKTIRIMTEKRDKSCITQTSNSELPIGGSREQKISCCSS